MAPQNKSQVPVGTILGGKFRVTREIGRGGMAAVYEAENVVIGKRVAVKVLAAELITSRIVRERFIREARAAAAIRSPYICDVYDSGMYEERPFLVMELLEGESLYDLMTRVRRLDLPTTLRIAVQTSRGLTKAHEANVIHRDLKPENIFLTHSEEGESVAKLLDFGLAKFYEPTGGDASQIRLTREGALFGTPAYMSPEQAKGQGEVDSRADLWALGCIVYECLTGQTVWNVDQGVAMILAQIANSPLPRPSRLRPDLPRSFDAWFAKALEREPSQRFQTAQEFADALSEAMVPDESKSRSTPAALHGYEEKPTLHPSSADSESLVTEPRGDDGLPREASERSPSTPRAPMRASVELSPQSNALRAIAALFVVGALALGGYALWLYVLNAPVAASAVVSEPSASAVPEPSIAPVTAGQALEREPYALQINRAQELLGREETDNAVKAFRDAFNNGGTAVARALHSHAMAFTERPNAPCQVTGLGRPRPFDITAPSSQPALAFTEFGTVVVWADNHLEAGKRQAFSVLVDTALRRITMVRGVTPEAENARAVELMPAGPRLVLLYADRAERGDSGVFARLLDRDGRIAGRAERISRNLASYQLNPAIARAEDGTLWVVWEDELAKGSRDLVARHLDAELKPLGPELRLTAWRPTPGMPTVLDTPAVVAAQGHLSVAFAFERAGLGQQRQIMLLRIPLTDKLLESGLKDAQDGKKGDRHLGKLQALSDQRGKLALPKITCMPDGCFVVWDDESGGAFAAFVDGVKGEKLWHRQFGRGTRPGVASTPAGAVVAWYEDKRVKLATLTRDGLGPASVLGRVNGYQPNPAMVAGKQPGEWYVSWRDYEAGHFESFVARVQCR